MVEEFFAYTNNNVSAQWTGRYNDVTELSP
jgi:hypothetical protein